jgi:hypothetical protein
VKTIRFLPDFSARSPRELRLFLEVQTAEKRHVNLEAALLCLYMIEKMARHPGRLSQLVRNRPAFPCFRRAMV